MISIIEDKEKSIDFNKPQLLKMVNKDVIIVTSGKSKKADGFLYIEGTIVGSKDPEYKTGDIGLSWRHDIWVKFQGRVYIASSDND